MNKILLIIGVAVLLGAAAFMIFRPPREIETTKVDTREIERIKAEYYKTVRQVQAVQQLLLKATAENKNIDKDTEIVETYGPDGKLVSRITKKKEKDTSTKTTGLTATGSSTSSTASSAAAITDAATDTRTSSNAKKESNPAPFLALGPGYMNDGTIVLAASINLFDNGLLDPMIGYKPAVGFSYGATLKIWLK
jgi:hypothetical protein